MCTYATEHVSIDGSAKGVPSWIAVQEATVYFDHLVHAQHEHTLNIDFRAPVRGPSARVAVELSAAVDRPNVMIKIPATAAGLPARDETGPDGVVADPALWAHMEGLGVNGLNARRREIDRLARDERIGGAGHGRWRVDPIPLVFDAGR